MKQNSNDRKIDIIRNVTALLCFLFFVAIFLKMYKDEKTEQLKSKKQVEEYLKKEESVSITSVNDISNIDEDIVLETDKTDINIYETTIIENEIVVEQETLTEQSIGQNIEQEKEVEIDIKETSEDKIEQEMEIKQEPEVEQEREKEDDVEAEKLPEFFTKDNINILNIKNAKNNRAKEKLMELLNNYVVTASADFKDIKGRDRIEMTEFYNGVKIIGDSQVVHIKYYGLLPFDNVAAMHGASVTEQYPLIDQYLSDKLKTVILWNGYNIAYYETANDLINAYNNLIDKIHMYSPDAKVYICSLMPATEERVLEDVEDNNKHKISSGPEYDKALEEYYGDNYINIKFLVRQDFYGHDGVHFMPQFYYVLLPYLSYYVNLEYD